MIDTERNISVNEYTAPYPLDVNEVDQEEEHKEEDSSKIQSSENTTQAKGKGMKNALVATIKQYKAMEHKLTNTDKSK